jgi:hypothetical protein
MFVRNTALRRGWSKVLSPFFRRIEQARTPYQFDRALLARMCLLGAAALAPSAALAVPNCSPATGDNVTVTCSGAVFNQGPEGNTGYGSGLQNGLTINVVASPPSSVTGTSIGIDVGSNNTINNFGTVTTLGSGGIGDVWGINANGTNLTVNNSGTIGRLDIPNFVFDAAGINALDTGLSVTNNLGATIQGSIGIQGVGTGTVVNSGLITGLTTFGGGEGIDFAANNTSVVTVTNNATGVITGDANGINANSAIVYNYGTISAPTAFGGGTGINANTLVLTNYASGLITGDGFGVSGSQTPNLTITNFGTISATGFAGIAIQGNVVTLVNSGNISGSNAISMTSGSITNNTGGVITAGGATIVSSGSTTVFNAGTITGLGGTAILFFGGGNTLTLGPGSVINGVAQGFGADTFQLGGTGTDSFNAALFATQFSGYSTFNKIGDSTWTLTGTNATAMPWTISSGTLNVNGTLANSTMTVNGGILSGTGTVGTTTIANGGTLMPGNGTRHLPDDQRQSRVPVRRALSGGAQSHRVDLRQRHRHRFAQRRRGSRLPARQLRGQAIYHSDRGRRRQRHVRLVQHVGHPLRFQGKPELRRARRLPESGARLCDAGWSQRQPAECRQRSHELLQLDRQHSRGVRDIDGGRPHASLGRDRDRIAADHLRCDEPVHGSAHRSLHGSFGQWRERPGCDAIRRGE